MASQLLKVVLLLCIASVSFAAVSITSVAPNPSTNSPTPVSITGTGFDTITITGITFSGIPCGGVVRQSAVSLTCTAQPGLGQDNRVVIQTTSAEGDHDYSANVVDFEAGTITACDASGDRDLLVDPSHVTSITICGTNFGAACDTTDHQEYTGRFDVNIAGFKADVLVHSDTKIVAKVPAAAGGQQKIKVNLGSQALVVPDVVISYPAPQVTSAHQDVSAKRAASTRIAVFGRHFGTPSPLIHVTVTVGSFPCVSINHVSDSELHCTVHGGYGANAAVVVIVNGQSSTSSNSVGAPAVRFDFVETATPGLACMPPYGAADAINPELCNCWAGAAPSSGLYADCDVHAICPGHITTQTVVSQFPPSRPMTEFKDDKLYITQTMPIVKNRRDTIIQFVTPALASINPPTANGTLSPSTCSYPGTIWRKTVNELDCVDTYSGILQWTQNTMCGFVEHLAVATDTHVYYKSDLVTTYTETFKAHDGTLSFRRVSNTFLITVAFQRRVYALTSTQVSVYIADPTQQGNLEVAVVGDALYDVASKNTLITFETTIVWPYQISAPTLAGTWKKAAGNAETGSVVATATIAAVQPGELECDGVQDTTCSQSWLLTIQTQPTGQPEATCNLHGLVEFSTGTLACRDDVPCPAGTPTTNFTITIGATDLCDNSDAADGSANLAHKLESFYDSSLTVPQNTFQTGDMIFFKVTVNDPTSTIDTIVFNNIVIINPATEVVTDTLYRVSPPLAPLDVAIQFNVTQEVTTPYTPVGTDAVLNFQFRLARTKLAALAGLSAADDLTKQLAVQATIDIFYHGNQKRTLVAAGSMPSVSRSVISFYDMPETEEELETNNTPVVEDDQMAELSLFASPASTTVASVAVAAVAAAALLA